MTFVRPPVVFVLSAVVIGFAVFQWILVARRLSQLFTLCWKVGQEAGLVSFGVFTSILFVGGSVGSIICCSLMWLTNVPQALTGKCIRLVALLGAVLISAGLLVWIAMLGSPMVTLRPR